MKKFALFLSAILLTITSFAQFQTPRYGTAPNQDNTGRQLTWGIGYHADTAGSTCDTLLTSFTGTAGRTTYSHDIILTVTDSCALAARTISGCHLGDRLNIIIENKTGNNHCVYFTGYVSLPSVWAMSSSGNKISLTSGKRATICFFFDGSAWVELSRIVQ